MVHILFLQNILNQFDEWKKEAAWEGGLNLKDYILPGLSTYTYSLVLYTRYESCIIYIKEPRPLQVHNIVHVISFLFFFFFVVSIDIFAL